MRFRQLEAFRAVMLCQTVTRAASMLCVSQPAVTRLLADLEESVGFALFVREKGRLHPTAEAHFLYEEVARSLIGVESIARAARLIKTQQLGRLNVAAPPSIALSFLPRAIADFLTDTGELNVILNIQDSRTIVDLVINRQCDVGIVNLSVSNIGTHGDSLFSVAHMCAVPEGHRLAKREVITPADLEGEVFLAHPPHLSTRLMIDAMFAAHGVKYKASRVETPVAAAACSLVAAGLGVSLIDAITALEYKGKDVRFIPFEPALPSELSVLTSLQAVPSKLVGPFIDHVRRFAASQLDPRAILK